MVIDVLSCDISCPYAEDVRAAEILNDTIPDVPRASLPKDLSVTSCLRHTAASTSRCATPFDLLQLFTPGKLRVFLCCDEGNFTPSRRTSLSFTPFMNFVTVAKKILPRSGAVIF